MPRRRRAVDWTLGLTQARQALFWDRKNIGFDPTMSDEAEAIFAWLRWDAGEPDEVRTGVDGVGDATEPPDAIPIEASTYQRRFLQAAQQADADKWDYLRMLATRMAARWAMSVNLERAAPTDGRLLQVVEVAQPVSLLGGQGMLRVACPANGA